MDLLSELIGEESIYNFLKKFPEKDWLEVIKKTLLYGIQTFEVINSSEIVHLITVKKERETLSGIENLNIQGKQPSQPEKPSEELQIKKQNCRLHINKTSSTPRSQKAASKIKNIASPMRKSIFDPQFTSRHNAKIKSSRNSFDSKTKIGYKNFSNNKNSSPRGERLNIKTSHVLANSSEKLNFSMQHKNKSLSSSSTMANAKVSESFSEFFSKDNGNWLKKENQQILVNIELNFDKTSNSALNYTTSPSDNGELSESIF